MGINGQSSIYQSIEQFSLYHLYKENYNELILYFITFFYDTQAITLTLIAMMKIIMLDTIL